MNRFELSISLFARDPSISSSSRISGASFFAVDAPGVPASAIKVMAAVKSAALAAFLDNIFICFFPLYHPTSDGKHLFILLCLLIRCVDIGFPVFCGWCQIPNALRYLATRCPSQRQFRLERLEVESVYVVLLPIPERSSLPVLADPLAPI